MKIKDWQMKETGIHKARTLITRVSQSHSESEQHSALHSSGYHGQSRGDGPAQEWTGPPPVPGHSINRGSANSGGGQRPLCGRAATCGAPPERLTTAVAARREVRRPAALPGEDGP
ncbi:hypothetical protein DIPPA_70007 [Diplonema papillatum]|nr:hypothetical protein DIPPA_70007 [Diplonema papillatum]